MSKNKKKNKCICKKCEFYIKDTDSCVMKNITKCTESNITECDKFLVDKRLVMF